MAFPNQSSAWNSAPMSLWWRSRYAAIQHICATQGKTLVESLQRVLIENLPLTYTVEGTLFLRHSLTVDGNFGPLSFAGMRAMLEGMDAPQPVRDAVRADYQRLCTASGGVASGARGLPVTLGTQAVMIWIGVHRLLPWADAVVVPDNMITARFALPAPPDDAVAGRIYCDTEANVTAGTPGAGSGTGAPGGSTSSTPTTPTSPTGTTDGYDAAGGGGEIVIIGLGLALLLAAGGQ